MFMQKLVTYDSKREAEDTKAVIQKNTLLIRLDSSKHTRYLD